MSDQDKLRERLRTWKHWRHCAEAELAWKSGDTCETCDLAVDAELLPVIQVELAARDAENAKLRNRLSLTTEFIDTELMPRYCEMLDATLGGPSVLTSAVFGLITENRALLESKEGNDVSRPELNAIK